MGYRFRKMVRRNKPQFLAASMVLFALLAGIAGTTWGMVRAERARVAETEERQIAEANEKKATESAEAERLAKLHAEAREEQGIEAAKREGIARKEAEAKDAEAKAIIQFFEDKVFAAGRPEGQDGGLGKDVTLQKAIDASLAKLSESFHDQPIIEARLRLTLGRTFSYLGENNRAL